MGSGIAKELADFSIRREARETILTKASDFLGEKINAFVNNFYSANAKIIEAEFVILKPEANGGTAHTIQQYELFQDFEAAIDSMLQAYLENNDISKKEFLQECQDSLNDKYCAFLDEDPNKWFVEALMAHASFRDFFRLMRSRHAHVKLLEKLEADSVQLFPKPAAAAPTGTSGAHTNPNPNPNPDPNPDPDPTGTSEHDLHQDLAQVKAPEIDMNMTLLADATVALKARIDDFVSAFCRRHAAALKEEFVGAGISEFTLRQHDLFREYHDAIDHILDEYLVDKQATKEDFLGQCKASLDDQFCALFEEDANKWFVQRLIGYAQFKNFFHLMLDKQTQLLIEESSSAVTDPAQQKEEDLLYGDF